MHHNRVDAIACNNSDLNRLHASNLLHPQDAIVGGSFDEEACGMQAHGARQLQAGKPRVHCSGGGGVEHVSDDGLTAAPTFGSCPFLFFKLDTALC